MRQYLLQRLRDFSFELRRWRVRLAVVGLTSMAGILSPSKLLAQAAVDSVLPAIERGDFRTAQRILEPLAASGDRWAYRNLGVVHSRLAETSDRRSEKEEYIQSYAHFRAAELLGESNEVGADRAEAAAMLSVAELKRASLRVSVLLSRHGQGALAASESVDVVAVVPAAASQKPPTVRSTPSSSASGRTSAAASTGAAVGARLPAASQTRSDTRSAGVREAPPRGGSDAQWINEQIDIMSLSVISNADRTAMATNIAARGRSSTASIKRALADAIESVPLRLEFWQSMSNFDAMARATTPREQERYRDKATGEMMIRETEYSPMITDGQRAEIAYNVAVQMVRALVRALGETGDQLAASTLRQLPDGLFYGSEKVIADAIVRAESGKPIAAVPVSASVQSFSSISHRLQVLVSPRSTFEDQKRVARFVARTAAGRDSLVRILMIEVVPTIQVRTLRADQRLAMLDPERFAQVDAETQVIKTIGFAICLSLQETPDLSQLSRIIFTANELKSANPDASLNGYLSRLIQTWQSSARD